MIISENNIPEEKFPRLTEALIRPQSHIKNLNQRLENGRKLRQVTSRKVQAEWKPPADRRDAVDLLIESSQGREEALIPIRYGQMMVSPFTFYRGGAAIMAYDLAHTSSTGLKLVADGDCHL